MKLGNPAHPLRARRQKRSPEMERPLLLSEAGAGHDADTGGVEEAEAVEFVGGALFFLRLVDGAGGKGDGWIEVH